MKGKLRFLIKNNKMMFWSTLIVMAIIPMIMLVISCAGNAKPAANSEGNSTASSGGMMTLDQALKEAATRIDERVAAKTKIAPLNFNSPHDKFSGYVLDEVTANLVDSRKLTVVDRKEVDLIRGEFDFQFSGEVGDDSMQQLGRMLGAQSIISGSLTDMGGFYRVVIRVLNVQNASVEVQYRANVANDTIMAALLTGGKTAVAARTPQRPQTAQPSAAPAAQTPAPVATPVQVAPAPPPAPVVPAPPPKPTTYKVGDTGPAGGVVFYDKGNNTGGWRYLEAASQDAGSVVWGTIGHDVGKTGIEIGTGKQNTQIILNYMMEKGENHPAAMVCRQYSQGGYSDWFLPSKSELNLMYWNIKQNGLGGFKNEWYWSSSQINDGRRDAWAQMFNDGSQFIPSQFYPNKQNVYLVRAIRQF